MAGNTEARFWSKVDQSGGADVCWPWLAARQVGLYGVFHPEHGKTVRAHRYALELSLGRKLAGREMACHRCDNPPCCNPIHLFAATHAENMRDMVEKGRSQRGAVHVEAVLTDEQVLAIRHLGAAGERQADIAAQYGVGISLISMILRGNRWAHIGGPLTRRYNMNRETV